MYLYLMILKSVTRISEINNPKSINRFSCYFSKLRVIISGKLVINFRNTGYRWILVINFGNTGYPSVGNKDMHFTCILVINFDNTGYRFRRCFVLAQVSLNFYEYRTLIFPMQWYSKPWIIIARSYHQYQISLWSKDLNVLN